MKKSILPPPLENNKQISEFGMQRRNMLKFFGASAALVTIGSACNKDDTPASNGGVNWAAAMWVF